MSAKELFQSSRQSALAAAGHSREPSKLAKRVEKKVKKRCAYVNHPGPSLRSKFPQSVFSHPQTFEPWSFPLDLLEAAHQESVCLRHPHCEDR